MASHRPQAMQKRQMKCRSLLLPGIRHPHNLLARARWESSPRSRKPSHPIRQSGGEAAAFDWKRNVLPQASTR